MKNEEICKILCLPRDVNCGDGHIENCVWVKNGRAVAAAAEAQVQAKTLAWIQEIESQIIENLLFWEQHKNKECDADCLLCKWQELKHKYEVK